MNKAFTKEDDGSEPPPFYSRFQPLAAGVRNLITPEGAATLRAEWEDLQRRLTVSGEAPALEGEQQQKLLRLEADDLAKRLGTHEIVESPVSDRVVFGATVRIRDEEGEERSYRIVGIDETNLPRKWISWVSPLASALLNQRVGSSAKVRTPQGENEIEILEISRAAS